MTASTVDQIGLWEFLGLLIHGPGPSGEFTVAIPTTVVNTAVEEGLITREDNMLFVTPKGKRYFKQGVQ